MIDAEAKRKYNPKFSPMSVVTFERDVANFFGKELYDVGDAEATGSLDRPLLWASIAGQRYARSGEFKILIGLLIHSISCASIYSEPVFGCLNHVVYGGAVPVTFELLGAPTGNCQRVAIALEEAGLPYTCRHIDLWRGEQRSAAHLRLNLAGKVPVLIERDGSGAEVVIAQSNAIMLHIARRGAVSLLPDAGTSEYAIALERFFYVVTDIIAPSHAGFFLQANQQLLQAALLEKKSLSALEFIEIYLTDAPFLAGQNFTLADICAVTMVEFNEARLEWNRLPNLRRWFDDVSSRPGVSRGAGAFRAGT